MVLLVSGKAEAQDLLMTLKHEVLPVSCKVIGQFSCLQSFAGVYYACT